MRMNIQLPPPVERAIQRLNAAGYEAYAVGGCVRDSLLCRVPDDWDITTSAAPEQTKAVFDGLPVIETGIQHGTVTVIFGGQPLEITTYRIDGSYSDSRHPDAVRFTRSLQEDLARRDFTVNALAYHPDTGIVDYFGGIEDLQRKIIRCVGEPDKRFTEDALRVMRGIRFSSQLSFSIESVTEASLRKHAPLLQKIAVERLRTELVKLLCGEHVKSVLLHFPDVLGQIIPEILPMVGFKQQTPYHIYDIYEHTAHSIAAVKNIPVLRLTMLLHDIGKPSRFTVDDKGQGHFKGHGQVSVAMSEKILPRLRFDKRTAERVLTLVKYHDVDLEPREALIKRWLNRLTPEGFFQLMEVKLADNAAQNPLYDRSVSYREIIQMGQDILNRKECFSLSALAVNGDDLIQMGIPAGKGIGEALQFLLQAVIDEKCENSRELLLEYCRNHRQKP